MKSDEALTRFRAPGEAAAEQRVWEVVNSAPIGLPEARRLRLGARQALLGVITGLAGALTLTPAGATVSRWIGHALAPPRPVSAPLSLPAPGRLLVSGSGGTWIVDPNGSRRRIGPWTQASWSPHGRFIAVTGRGELAAVDPRGSVQWLLWRPHVSDPRWFSPSGYRVAYLSDAQLRVAAGDGTGDHPVAAEVAQVAPAWRPGHPYQLAYVTTGGRLLVRDADSGRLLWRVADRGVRNLGWSADGQRLLSLSPHRAAVYSGGGQQLVGIDAAQDRPFSAGALSPDGRTIALLAGAEPTSVLLAAAGAPRPVPRQVFAGAGLRQLEFSPNGRWLLIDWPRADQWLFLRVAGAPRIAAVAGIAQELGATARSATPPHLDGWCCVAAGPLG